MLKVSVNRFQYNPAPSYPYLAIDKESDLIIFLYNYAAGVCVQQGDTRFPIGYHTLNWHMHKLQPFDGSVTLENKRE